MTTKSIITIISGVAMLMLTTFGIAQAMPPSKHHTHPINDHAHDLGFVRSPGQADLGFGRSILPIGYGETMRPVRRSPVLDGTNNVIAIRIQFTDVQFDQDHNDAYYRNIMDQSEAFYDAVSNGRFDLQITLSDVYTLSHALAYYGADEPGSADVRKQDMLQEMLALSDPDVDFSQYDSIIVVHAADGQELANASTDSIWSTRSGLQVPFFSNDGVYITGMPITPGKYHDDSFTTIGATVHEYGHEIGLLDLYDVSSPATHQGIGEWSLMSEGSWGGHGQTPTWPNAWELMLLGWIDVEEIFEPGNYTLPKLSAQDRKIYKIYAKGPWEADEYFLVSLRRQGTSWNTDIPSEGLAIWHVDEAAGRIHSLTRTPQTRWEVNEVNIDPAHKMVDLEEATGTQNLDAYEGSSTAQTLFYLGNNDSFTPQTNPNSNCYDGSASGVKITNISAVGDTMTFDVDFDFRPISVTLASATEVLVEFSQPPAATNETTDFQLLNIGIENGTSASPTTVERINGEGGNPTVLKLTFAQEIDDDWVYHLTIGDLTSEGGTQMGEATIENAFGTVLKGNLVDDMELGPEGNPYWVKEDLSVSRGATVKILPGTRILVAKNAAAEDGDWRSPQVDIIVYGTLLAQGSSDAPILITSDQSAPNPGDWGQLVFDGQPSENSVLDFVRIEEGAANDAERYRGVLELRFGANITVSNSWILRAGGQPEGYDCAVSIRKSSPTFRNSVFQADAGTASYAVGMYFNEENSSPTLESNTVRDNAGWGLVTATSFDGNAMIVGNAITGNGTGVYFAPDIAQPTVMHNYTQGNNFGPGVVDPMPLTAPVPEVAVLSEFNIYAEPGWDTPQTSLAVDSPLWIEAILESGNDEMKEAFALHISSETDPDGIYLHMMETAVDSNVYRTSGEEGLAEESDQDVYELGHALNDELTLRPLFTTQTFMATVDGECTDDGVSCTVEGWDGSTCTHTPDDSLCPSANPSNECAEITWCDATLDCQSSTDTDMEPCGDEGQYCWEHQCVSAPEGDSCDTAIPVTGTTYNGAFDNYRPLATIDSTCLDSAVEGPDMWLTFSVTAGSEYSFVVYPDPTVDVAFAIHSDCDTLDSCIEGVDDAAAGDYEVSGVFTAPASGNFVMHLVDVNSSDKKAVRNVMVRLFEGEPQVVDPDGDTDDTEDETVEPDGDVDDDTGTASGAEASDDPSEMPGGDTTDGGGGGGCSQSPAGWSFALLMMLGSALILRRRGMHV